MIALRLPIIAVAWRLSLGPRLCAETPLSPEEWRTFRAALIAGEGGGYPEAGDFRAGSPTPENESQLAQQSEQLYAEYQRGGSWAHPTSTPEPGGLMCAMPLQAILMHRLYVLRESNPNTSLHVH